MDYLNDFLVSLFLVQFASMYVAIFLQEKGWFRLISGCFFDYATAMCRPIIVFGSALIAAIEAFAKEFMTKIQWILSGKS